MTQENNPIDGGLKEDEPFNISDQTRALPKKENKELD
jgi:hypothetical protein